MLNRPRRHNAVTAALRDGLAEALTLAVVDDTITAVRLSGNGPSFCSGGDLGEFGSFPDPATAHITRLTRSPARLAHLLADRLHVQLHGACMGAGIEVPAFARHVTATADARIALPELGIGLVPGAGGTVSIPRRIGRHRAAALALSGVVIDAADGAGVGTRRRGRLTSWQADRVVDDRRAAGPRVGRRARRGLAGARRARDRRAHLAARPGLEHGAHGPDPADPANVRRVRNIGADVAVGDWVVPSDDGERVDHVLPAAVGVRPAGVVRGVAGRGRHAGRQHRRRLPDPLVRPRRRTSVVWSGSSCWPTTAAPSRSSC